MNPSTLQLLLVGLCTAVCVSISSALADPMDPPGENEKPSSSVKDDRPLHTSSARIDPDRSAETVEKTFRIERGGIHSEEWQTAIKCALSHQSRRGFYTLMRLVVNESDKTETIQAAGTKLKELTEQYHGGGGTYQVLDNGGFVFLEHINSSRRRNGRDPVTLGANSHGTTELWVDVPPNGVLGVLGDVVLNRCADEDTGVFVIRGNPDGPLEQMKLMIGTVVVGGPYGDTHTFDSTAGIRLRLPGGHYKILLPQFDLKKSRWDVEIEPKTVTRFTLATDGKQVEKTEVIRIPIRRTEQTPASPPTDKE